MIALRALMNMKQSVNKTLIIPFKNVLNFQCCQIKQQPGDVMFLAAGDGSCGAESRLTELICGRTIFEIPSG